MKIGFDAKRAFNNHTGLGNYSRFIIDALIKYAPTNEYFAFTPQQKKEGTAWGENYKALKIRLPHSKKFKSLWRSYFIKNDLKENGIQVFHGLSNEIPFGLKSKKIKSVVTIHDLIFERYPGLYLPFDRFIYQIKFRKACKQSDKIIAISEQTKRDIVEFYKINADKIEVIYQDCDEAFHHQLDEEQIEDMLKKYQIQKKYILCVATITERKNQLMLLKAFQKLHLSDYELVLVGGKTDYQTNLETFIQKHQLSHIKIFNKVPFGDLPALYQGANLFVYPSFFEGFGIPIVEALHSGVPVIAASGSCLEEAGGKGALYADPEDVNDLSSKILQVLSNKSLQKQMVIEGQKHIEQFSAKNIALQLNKLYEQMVQNNSK